MKKFLLNSTNELINAKMLNLSIIIVSFNTKEILKKCLQSLEENGLKGQEIIVVDNASTDGNQEMIKKEFPRIKLVCNSENIGFAKANNQGIKEAMGKDILLLNSDIEVKEGSINKLYTFAEKHQEAGAVVPRLLNPDGSPQPSVFRLPTLWLAIKQYWFGQKGLLDKSLPVIDYQQSPVVVESAVMAAFLITSQALKKVGLLNEKYFMYFEDLDYCKRVNKSGLKIYYLPEVEIVHRHGMSGNKLVDDKNQWRRLIPSSKVYHGLWGHYLFNFVLWSSQKWQKYISKVK